MKAGAGRYILVSLGIAIVIAAIVGGLMVLGPPAEQRERRMDDKRVEDLAAIGRAADLYQSRHGELPPSLGQMEQEAGSALSTHDPGTQRLYEYRVLGSDKYELCAEFKRDSTRRASGPGDFWYHGAGRRCFVLGAQKIHRQR